MNQFVTFVNSNLGGVLDRIGQLTLYTKERFSIHLQWKTGPACTIKSILSSKVPGKIYVLPKHLGQNCKHEVHYVQQNTIHQDGLFPLGGLFHVKTFAPFIYSSTKFCCCVL